MNKPFLVLASVVLVLLGGCASGPKELYYWGHYEQILYDIYVEPGQADTETQILKLTEDIQRAEAKGLSVAPGIYAHIGVLYANKGELSSAMEAFAREQELFPESKNFISGMISRAGLDKQ